MIYLELLKLSCFHSGDSIPEKGVSPEASRTERWRGRDKAGCSLDLTETFLSCCLS